MSRGPKFQILNRVRIQLTILRYIRKLNFFFVSYIFVSAFLKYIIYADRKEAHCVVNSIHVVCIEETFYPLLGAIHDPSGYGTEGEGASAKSTTYTGCLSADQTKVDGGLILKILCATY